MGKQHRRTVPFSGVDSLMRGLDEVHRPQTIELEVALEDRLDEQRLRDAVATAANRHPFARVRQLPARSFDLDYRWEIADALRADPVELCTPSAPELVDAARESFFSRHIDLGSVPPFRVLLMHEAVGDRVMLSVNHSAFDGMGSVRLLQSISRAYAGEEDPLPAIGPIAAREFVEHEGRRRALRRGPIAQSLRLPVRPARLSGAPSVPTAGFGILHLDLGLDQVVPPAHSTVNDVLVAGLHATVERWNRSRGAPCDRISTMVPVNQRPQEWRGEIVANLVLAGQVFSSPRDRVRTRDLLATVAAQTKVFRTRGVGEAADLMRSVPMPVAIRRLMPRLVDAVADFGADTAVMSNLGRIASPPWFGGNGRGIWFSAPPRAPVDLTVGAATAGEYLGISLRWCKPALSPEDARSFADSFLASLIDVQSTEAMP